MFSYTVHEDSDIVLEIGEPGLNVINFICLNLIALPAMEVLTDMLMCRLGTLALLRRKTVRLCDTRLGVLTLYSSYFGQRRNLFFLILLGAMVIATELFIEFCASSTQTRNVEVIRVWREADMTASGALKSLFLENPFNSSDNFHFNVAPLDNDLFVFQTSAMACVTGDFQHKPKSFGDRDMLRDIVSGPYASSGLFIVHHAYLTEDNITVCDYLSSVPGWVEFEMPPVVKQGNNYTTPSLDWSSLLGDENSITWGPRLSLGNSMHSSYRADGLVCVGVNEIEHDCSTTAIESVICILIGAEQTFAYGEGYMLNKQDVFRKSQNRSSCPGLDLVLDIKLIRVFGKVWIEASSFSFHGPRLTIFLMTLLSEGFVRRSEHELVEKKRVQDILRLFLIAVDHSFTNMDGIGGLREELREQSVQMEHQLSQTPTMSKLAYGPSTLLVSTMILLILLILYYRRRISAALEGQKCDGRFDTSVQYLRRGLLRKLQAVGVDAELHDVALRLNRQHDKWRIQLLPDLSSIKQPP